MPLLWFTIISRTGAAEKIMASSKMAHACLTLRVLAGVLDQAPNRSGGGSRIAREAGTKEHQSPLALSIDFENASRPYRAVWCGSFVAEKILIQVERVMRTSSSSPESLMKCAHA